MKEENLKKLHEFLFIKDHFSNCNVKGNTIAGYNGGISDELEKQLLDKANDSGIGIPKIRMGKLFDMVSTQQILIISNGTDIKIPEYDYRRYPDGATIFITSFVPSEFYTD